MRKTMTGLLFLILFSLTGPGYCTEPPFEVIEYAPCEVQWVENGRYIGVCVGGEYREGRISPIEFNPLDRYDLRILARHLKSAKYLDAGYPEDDAIAVLEGFAGRVDASSPDKELNPVLTALINSVEYGDLTGLPPQIELWRMLAAADAVCLDDSQNDVLAGEDNQDLALYAYLKDQTGDYYEYGSTLSGPRYIDLFIPIGLVAFEFALDSGYQLNRDDWPAQYALPDRPWANLTAADPGNGLRLLFGQWEVGTCPLAARIEFDRRSPDDAGWTEPNGSTCRHNSYEFDDRGRLTIMLRVIDPGLASQPGSSPVRLLNGGSMHVNYRDPDRDFAPLYTAGATYGKAWIESLRNRAGLK